MVLYIAVASPSNRSRYSFKQLSELGRRGKNEKPQATKQQQRGFGHGLSRLKVRCSTAYRIGLYRDVWIAAIASSRTRLATLTGAMCKTSQCELRSLRVNSGMLNVIRIVTYYTLPPLESPTSSWIAMAFWR